MLRGGREHRGGRRSGRERGGGGGGLHAERDTMDVFEAGELLLLLLQR